MRKFYKAELFAFNIGPLLTNTQGAKVPPAPMLHSPVKGFAPPPSKSPFSLKMSTNHTEISPRNHPGELKNSKKFLGEDPQTHLKSLFPHCFPAHALI